MAAADPCALVIQTSFLGDTVLTTPLLQELARRGPVDVVARPDAATLLAGHPAIRDVVVFDKRGADRGVRGLLRLVRRLRTRPDGTPRPVGAAYLAQSSFRSALIPWLLGVRRRVGWAGAPAGRLLYTHRVAVPAGGHFAERCWRLAFAGEAPRGRLPRPLLAPGSADRAAAEALLGTAFDAADARPLVVLAPGSAWGTKRWPYFPALAQALAPRVRLAVIGGPEDRALATAIAGQVPGTLDATGRLSLLGSAALIARAAAIVSNDSVALHLASAVDTPTVALFGPTVPAFGFGPLASRSRTLEHPSLSCRPCHHHGPATCPLQHHRCMTEIAPARVAAAVEELVRPPVSPGPSSPATSRPALA